MSTQEEGFRIVISAINQTRAGFAEVLKEMSEAWKQAAQEIAAAFEKLKQIKGERESTKLHEMRDNMQHELAQFDMRAGWAKQRGWPEARINFDRFWIQLKWFERFTSLAGKFALQPELQRPWSEAAKGLGIDLWNNPVVMQNPKMLKEVESRLERLKGFQQFNLDVAEADARHDIRRGQLRQEDAVLKSTDALNRAQAQQADIVKDTTRALAAFKDWLNKITKTRPASSGLLPSTSGLADPLGLGTLADLIGG